MHIIKKINYYNIPEVTRTFNNCKSNEQKRKILSDFMDTTMVDKLDNTTIDKLFTVAYESVETQIKELIKERTKEEPMPIGTKVIMRYDFNNSLKKGDEVEIEHVGRFEEDTFGYGWYYYIIKGNRVYRYEFDIVE